MNIKYVIRHFAIVAFMILQFLKIQTVMAQQELRAQIKKIAFKQAGKEEEIKKKTDRVQYRRRNKPDWVEAEPKAKLYDRDRVLIKPFTFAKLEMQGATAAGHFTLWGDTTQKALPAAAFEIQKDPVKLGWYGLFVTYGSFVADKMRGMITAKSPAMEVRHHGTRYLMTVEKETGRTFLFVDKGEVTVFAGEDSLRLKSLEAVQALPGGLLEKINLSSSSIQKISQLMRTNHNVLWRQFKPWWQSPYFLGSAAVTVGGIAAWQLLKPPPDDDNLAKGTITVYW